MTTLYQYQNVTLSRYLMDRWDEEVTNGTLPASMRARRVASLNSSAQRPEGDNSDREALLDSYAAPYLSRPDFRPEWR